MSIEAAKAISIRSLIERETGLSFRKNKLHHCPLCNSGNNGHGDSDSAFSIDDSIGKNYFKCFSCQSGGSTIDFIMKFKELDTASSITYLEQNYLGEIRIEPSHPIVVPQAIPEYIPKEIMLRSMNSQGKNNLKRWLHNCYGDEAEKAISQYMVGTSKYKEGATVFFYIDEVQQIRRGKVMLYSPDTGKRDRSVHPTWIHSLLKLKNKPKQCLFGIHLIDKYPDKTVAIVESEKTAIIMSIIVPNNLWMATGGLGFLKPEMFNPLRTREVILFPDTGIKGTFGTPYEQWERKLPTIKEIVPNVALSDLLERKATMEQRNEGWDIADYFTELNLTG